MTVQHGSLTLMWRTDSQSGAWGNETGATGIPGEKWCAKVKRGTRRDEKRTTEQNARGDRQRLHELTGSASCAENSMGIFVLSRMRIIVAEKQQQQGSCVKR